MSLEALFASPKGGPNPLQQLVDHYWKAQSMRSVLSSYPQDSKEYSIVTKLDNTRGLIEELEKLTSKDSKQKVELDSLDLTGANRTFDDLVRVDNEEGVFLQALLDFEFEREWDKAQENSKAAEAFVSEFVVLEEAYIFSSLQLDLTKADVNESLINREDGHTKYEDAFYKFMADVVLESSENVKYNFGNAGSNLVFFMRCCAEPRDFARDYETECTELKKVYQALTSRIEEIKKSTSKDALALPVNHFIRSIDSFLEAVLQDTYAYEMLSGDTIKYKSISNVSICHDCLTQTYEILNDKNVFVLGDNV